MMNDLYISENLVIAFKSPCRHTTTLLSHMDKHGKIDFPFKVGWAFPRGEDDFDIDVGMNNADSNTKLTYFKLDSMFREGGKWIITLIARNISITIYTDVNGVFKDWHGVVFSYRKECFKNSPIGKNYDLLYKNIYGVIKNFTV